MCQLTQFLPPPVSIICLHLHYCQTGDLGGPYCRQRDLMVGHGQWTQGAVRADKPSPRYPGTRSRSPPPPRGLWRPQQKPLTSLILLGAEVCSLHSSLQLLLLQGISLAALGKTKVMRKHCYPAAPGLPPLSLRHGHNHPSERRNPCKLKGE